jgi:hypothetical protein
MPKKKTKEEFIENAIKVHGNKYNYSKVGYENSYTKVIIICKTINTPRVVFTKLVVNYVMKHVVIKQLKNTEKKSKEWIVIKYLQEKLPDQNFIHNESVGSQCTKMTEKIQTNICFPIFVLIVIFIT